MTAAIRAAGTWVVPGNRWDLLPEADTAAHVTAVVTHYRDPRRLALVIAALEAQTHPASRLQVVVADDGSPEPPDVPSHVRVVRQDDLGFRAAAARNLGARAADGDVLCFLDGDTVPEPGYVAAASALPASGSDTLVVGRRRHGDLSGWTPDDVRAWTDGRRAAPPEFPEPAWLRDAYADSDDLLRVDARSYRFVISAVLTVHRELFDAADGFDETFTEYGGEDWDFAHRSFTAGAVLAHRRDAVAWHDGPDWAERGSPVERHAQKEREDAALAVRIPDRDARGPGRWPTAPRALVEVHGGTVDDRARCAARIRSASTDVAFDVHDRCILQRIPWYVRVHTDAAVDAAGLDELVDRAEAAQAGRLVAPGVEIVAARAARRAARHGVAVDQLFPVLTSA